MISGCTSGTQLDASEKTGEHDDTPDCADTTTESVTKQPNVPITDQPLSKRAKKRLAKSAMIQEKKLERRRREKAAKKEKKRERRERVEAGDVDEEEPIRKKQKINGPKQPFSARIVVDLGFDDKMFEKVRI